jgi:hypothetical protein
LQARDRGLLERSFDRIAWFVVSRYFNNARER